MIHAMHHYFLRTLFLNFNLLIQYLLIIITFSSGMLLIPETSIAMSTPNNITISGGQAKTVTETPIDSSFEESNARVPIKFNLGLRNLGRKFLNLPKLPLMLTVVLGLNIGTNILDMVMPYAAGAQQIETITSSTQYSNTPQPKLAHTTNNWVYYDWDASNRTFNIQKPGFQYGDIYVEGYEIIMMGYRYSEADQAFYEVQGYRIHRRGLGTFKIKAKLANALKEYDLIDIRVYPISYIGQGSNRTEIIHSTATDHYLASRKAYYYKDLLVPDRTGEINHDPAADNFFEFALYKFFSENW